MIPYYWTSTALGLGIAFWIMFLVRRDHMQSRYALWWLVVAVVIVLLGAMPKVVDQVASRLGVHYPPIFLVILAIGMILIKMLTMDIERSRQERTIRKLVQKIALLEGEKE